MLHLLEPSTLMLRMRAGFGVGAKADLLVFLLGVATQRGPDDTWVQGAPIAEALAYSKLSVRRAANDMALAGLVEVSGDRSPDYLVDRDAWVRLLGLSRAGRASEAQAVAEIDHPDAAIPGWCFWAQTFDFLGRCARWGRQVREASAPSSVAASWARDIVDGSRTLYRRNGWPLLQGEAHPGDQILQPFVSTVEFVADWVDAHL